MNRMLTLEIRQEADVVLARQRARQLAGLLGFPPLDQTRIATATSEIARNAYQYAGGGKAEFLIDGAAPPSLVVRVFERGPGVEDIQAILSGEYVSETGLGLGILGARRLMDRFEIITAPGSGATVTMAKALPDPQAVLAPPALARISAELARSAPEGLLGELQQQNQELVRTLHELRDRQNELMELHRRELDETNRGVVALYAELDDHAKALQRMSELKSRFLSNMSHEFRTPLNSILTLTGFLLAGSDGALNSEQEKQVGFIRKAADGLSGLVNDLLDLAKIEAGKAVVRPKRFTVVELFDGLRGTIEPLLAPESVALAFEGSLDEATLWTDDGKLAQILRNFLSNAAKFTERGTIRVAADEGPGRTVIFSVSDTGIGIAPEDQRRIFEEFGQVEGPLQAKTKGTGLGLPLSRRLAELLGGEVYVTSRPGSGSTFYAVIPTAYQEPEAGAAGPRGSGPLDPDRLPLLVVGDEVIDLLLYERILEDTPLQVVPARSLDETRRALRRVRPVAVLLDPVAQSDGGRNLVAELRGRATTRDVPVLLLTRIEGRERALALRADDLWPTALDADWLRERLGTPPDGAPDTVLLIGDALRGRQRLQELLAAIGRRRFATADSGQEGLRKAREDRPETIVVDVILPDMTGLELLHSLKRDPDTESISVILHTPKHLEEHQRRHLGTSVSAVLEQPPGDRPAAFGRIRDALVEAGLALVPAAPEG